MIDRQAFITEMALLQERFGRQFSKPVLDRYYTALSQRLDTARFVAACQRCFNEDEFFPSPDRLVHKVLLSADDSAVLEWERVLTAASGANQAADMSEAGRRALKAVGGLHAVGLADVEYQVPRLRKEFMESYKAHANADPSTLPKSAGELTAGELAERRGAIASIKQVLGASGGQS